MFVRGSVNNVHAGASRLNKQKFINARQKWWNTVDVPSGPAGHHNNPASPFPAPPRPTLSWHPLKQWGNTYHSRSCRCLAPPWLQYGSRGRDRKLQKCCSFVLQTDDPRPPLPSFLPVISWIETFSLKGHFSLLIRFRLNIFFSFRVACVHRKL